MASIQRNRFTFSGGFVISLGRVYPADRQILDNRFQGESTSRAWIRGYSGDVEVHENFFDQNSGIALSVELATTPVRMNAERNYWGTTDATQIQSRILDKNDNISLPTVIPFEPVLTTPSPRIPVGILYSLGVSLYGDRCVSCELHVEPGAFRPSATTTTYQWLRGGEPIPGATDPSYFVTDADADHYISVEVTGYRDRFESLTVTSDGVRIPTPHNLEVASEAGPYLIGDPFVGNTLTAGWDRSSFIPEADRVLYQWYRDGEVIEGATSPDYELLQSDLGHTVSVETVAQRARYRTFTVSDFGGYTVTMGRLVTSKALALEGTGEVGSRLTATRFETNDFSPMADNVSYVWIRIDDRGNGSSIWGANSDTYTPTVDDIGYKVTVGITATKSDYEDYSLGSRVIRIRQADPIVLKTSRFHGPSRYGTNRAVNAFTAVQGNPVFIASGANYPDALSVGPAVRMLEGALFLTAPQQMEHATLVAIKNLQPSAVYIVGGTGAVSASVESALKRETGKKPVRVSGANRYETSKAIYDTFFAKHNPSRVFIATGRDYPDALSAASAAGALSAPVLLVDGTAARSLPNPLVAQLQNGGTQTVLIAGGTGVVNTSIESSLKRQFPSVHRLAGPNRYATNLKISQYLDSLEAADPVESIWVATGTNFPDALSAAAPAGTPRSRLVLSNGACIPSPVVSGWIKSPSSRVSNLFLVGGTAVLGKSVESLRQC